MRLEKLEGVRGHFPGDPACTPARHRGGGGPGWLSPLSFTAETSALWYLFLFHSFSNRGWLAEGQGNPPFKKESRVSADCEKQGRGLPMTGGLDRDLLESRGEHETCLSERNDRLLETESAEFCLNRGLRRTGRGARPSWLSPWAGGESAPLHPAGKALILAPDGSLSHFPYAAGKSKHGVSWDRVSVVTVEGLGRK